MKYASYAPLPISLPCRSLDLNSISITIVILQMQIIKKK